MPSRRLLALISALAVMVTPLSAAAGEAKGSGVFVDDNQSRYEPFIETAARNGVVYGCNPPANNRFCPHDTVTRGQAAMMLARAAQLPRGAGNHFSDDDGLTAEPAIEALVDAGATQGCGEGRFCPDRQLTRGELAALVSGTLGLEPDDTVWPYVDLKGTTFGRQVATLGRRGHLDACDPPVGRRMCPAQAVTRSEAAFAVASTLHLDPVAPRAAATAPPLDFADGFETLALWDGRPTSGRDRVRLTDGGYRGRGLRVTIPRSSHYGTDFRLDLERVAGSDPEELYFRYMLRLDSDWSPKWSGKLPGFSGVYGRAGKGGYRSSPSSPGWSARLQFFGTRHDDDRARLGYYVYHLGQERRYGDSMMWNEAGKLRPGEWYCIEGEVKLNTPGLADGRLRAWVDGTPAFDASGIEFRRPDEPNIRIESFWFNVYYGGKPTAERDMGLTIDEVAVDTTRVECGTGAGLDRVAAGDVSGDGLGDTLWWGSCPGGTCFHLRRTTSEGRQPMQRLGDGAWFSLATHRLGFATGDVDGDGRDDVVYPGRCGGSKTCWRVHRSGASMLHPGEDWGTGLRLGPGPTGLIAGDWNGDGRDDLAYPSVCGSPAHPCWRLHHSTGDGFASPDDGGKHLRPEATRKVATDVTGDGRDDLVYLAPCGDDQCWFAQFSVEGGFAPPRKLAASRKAERELAEWFDLTGDARSDLVTARKGSSGWRVEMRPTRKELGEPAFLARVEGEVTGLLLRRPDGRPAEAVVTTTCAEAKECVSHRFLRSGRLLREGDYRRQVTLQRVSTLDFPPE